jgi:hypothetical protein
VRNSIPNERDIDPDFPREWWEFTDPDNPDHLIRADLTWLLSHWTCLFPDKCPGILAGRASDGCCSHGAFFTDRADEKRIRTAATKLTTKTWQHYLRGFNNYTVMDTVKDSAPARRTATRPDGPCVFLNDQNFPGGHGCALHAQALRDGVHPLAYKPDVCWQLPIRRDQEWGKRADDTDVLISTLSEFDRRSWGEGGQDLNWWCTSAPEAHISVKPLYLTYETELHHLIGINAYKMLRVACDARASQGLISPHPADAGKDLGLELVPESPHGQDVARS